MDYHKVKKTYIFSLRRTGEGEPEKGELVFRFAKKKRYRKTIYFKISGSPFELFEKCVFFEFFFFFILKIQNLEFENSPVRH